VDRVEILGCKLDVLDAGEAAARIMAFAREGTGAQVVTLGTEMVVHAQKDERFRDVVNASALSLCDTVGVLSVARRRGAHLHDRVTGIELVERLCREAAREGLSVYFLGGAEGAAADAAAIMEARFPGLIVAGTRNGFFGDPEIGGIVEEIRQSHANLLFVGLGSPRQELWLAEHLRGTGAGAAIGVGGSFDVLGGRATRAPRFMRRFGLEWLYRLIKEPHRWRRQLALPYFVWLVVLDGFGFSNKKGLTHS
jgi:N-acetylglucosaminyldiphosphoundecaprenol N-acetyl-beta-D-mannosaminyltransferase